MAVNKLKKINVRSPYYISVAKPVSEGGIGEEEVTAPTEPVNREQTIVCGDTVQVGVDVGTRVYKMSIAGRVYGDYTIALANVTVPIKYRIGHADNMPAFSVAGTNNYVDEYTAATGDNPSLSSITTYPNGVSVNATYTSTLADVTSYGEEIQLEIQQPLITDGYSFSLTCPDFITEANAIDNVVIASIMRTNVVGQTGHSITMNGTSLGTLGSHRQYECTRFVFDTSSPDIFPEGNGYAFHNRNDVGINPHYGPRNATSTVGGITISHKSPAILRGSASNQLVMKNTEASANVWHQYRILISRHVVETVSGVKYIRGSKSGFDAEAIICEFGLAGGETITLNFTGSNTEELATGITTRTIRAAGEGPDGFDEINIQSTLFTINKL